MSIEGVHMCTGGAWVCVEGVCVVQGGVNVY